MAHTGGDTTHPPSRAERPALARWTALLTLLAILATVSVLYVQLAKRSRFTPDDLCAFSYVQSKGVLGTQVQLFQTWSGRWASNFLIAAFMRPYSAPGSLFAYSLFLYALVGLTIAVFARATLGERIERTPLVLTALATTALLFLMTPHRGDSWFFAYSSVENLWPISFGLIGFAAVARAERSPKLALLGGAMGALATAGHQCVALVFLASCAFALALSFVPRLGRPDSSRARLALVVMLVAAIASFAVCVSAPGDRARLAFLGPISLPQAVLRSVTGGPGLLWGVAAAHGSVLATVLLLWLVVAAFFATDRRGPLEGRRVFWRSLAALSLLLIAAMATAFPGFYALNELPPTRAQVVLAAMHVGVAAFVGLQLGATTAVARRRTAWLAAMVAVALITMARERSVIVQHVDMLRAYAHAYDARMARLGALGDYDPESGPITLEPLPPNEPFRSAEISDSLPRSYPNECLRKATKLETPLLRQRRS